MKPLAPTLDRWEKTGLRFEHQGHSIFYRDEGEGPPLLCVHGFPTASWDWQRLWPELASVCFLNGGLFPEVHRALLALRLLLSPLGPLVARLMNERRFRATFPSIFAPATRPSQEDLHAFWTLIAYADGPRIAHKVIRYMVERRA